MQRWYLNAINTYMQQLVVENKIWGAKGEAAVSRLAESLANGSQAPRCPDNNGAALEPKWLRTMFPLPKKAEGGWVQNYTTTMLKLEF